MFSRRKKEVYLPGWLWFFLILPFGLIVLLLYRQNRLEQLRERVRRRLASIPQPFHPSPRYTEPDSIPLEIRPDVAVVSRMDTEVATGTETEENTDQTEPATPDDLELIEGIGPRISEILRDSGIKTFRQLATTPVERLDEILTNARLRRLTDPATWPEQARLAADGDWDGFEQLKGILKGGRRTKQE